MAESAQSVSKDEGKSGRSGDGKETGIDRFIGELTELTELASARLKATKEELAATKEELAATKEEAAIKSTELSDLREENGLILLQLHQVQEELEFIFLEKLKLERGEARASECYAALMSENKRYWIETLAKSTSKLQIYLGKKILSLTYFS